MNEPLIRLAVFGLVLAALDGWELLHPRRPRALSRRSRWPANIALVVLNTLLVRVLFPLGAAGVALWAERQGVGLLNVIAAPRWLAFDHPLWIMGAVP